MTVGWALNWPDSTGEPVGSSCGLEARRKQRRRQQWHQHKGWQGQRWCRGGYRIDSQRLQWGSKGTVALQRSPACPVPLGREYLKYLTGGNGPPGLAGLCSLQVLAPL